jgi:hypothetical protein
MTVCVPNAKMPPLPSRDLTPTDESDGRAQKRGLDLRGFGVRAIPRGEGRGGVRHLGVQAQTW